MADVPALLTSLAELEATASTIRRAGRVALDTEFVWERTYAPILGLVQLAIDDTVVLVDTTVVPDLGPLFDVLRDPSIPVILHGGGQDLEIFARLMGDPIRGVFDTQVEAAFLGYGLQIGLSMLLERVLKVRIKKDQTYTDWTRRPLRPEQLAYARADVAHLLPLHDRLWADLERRNRATWVREELDDREDPARWAPTPEEERYRDVKGWMRLDPRELAVLRDLAAWRERAARRANVRPAYMANDATLTAMALRPPRSLDELRQVRGLSSGAIDRHGRAMLTAVEAGVACPDADCPRPPARSRKPPPPSGLIALLRAAVQAVADRDDLAPEVIASAHDFEQLVDLASGRSGAPTEDAVTLLHGWRRSLVGEALLAIARGQVAMRYDPSRREVIAVPVTSKA